MERLVSAWRPLPATQSSIAPRVTKHVSHTSRRLVSSCRSADWKGGTWFLSTPASLKHVCFTGVIKRPRAKVCVIVGVKHLGSQKCACVCSMDE